MAKKIYKPGEIVNLLRQVEVAVANGKMPPRSWSRRIIGGGRNMAG